MPSQFSLNACYRFAASAVLTSSLLFSGCSQNEDIVRPETESTEIRIENDIHVISDRSVVPVQNETVARTETVALTDSERRYQAKLEQLDQAIAAVKLAEAELSEARKSAAEKAAASKAAAEKVASEKAASEKAASDIASAERAVMKLQSPDETAEEATVAVAAGSTDGATTSLETEATEPPSFSPETMALRMDVRNALGFYFDQRESVANRKPWELMHAALAFGKDTEFLSAGESVNAIEWLCDNAVGGAGTQMLSSDNAGLNARIGPGYQGHPGQLLAVLAQCNVPVNQTLTVGDKAFSVSDLIEYEKGSCQPATELTFVLIGLSHYLSPDDNWMNKHGQWNLKRVLREELIQPIRGASCGGTHRLMGISQAIRHGQRHGIAMEDGVWADAVNKINDYKEQVLSSMQTDGAFSNQLFNTPIAHSDLNNRLWVSGHFLEWLMFELGEEEIRDPQIEKAVHHVAGMLLKHRGFEWAIGKKYHALHALAMYNERVFGSEGLDYQVARSELPAIQAVPASPSNVSYAPPAYARQVSSPSANRSRPFRRRRFGN